VFSATKEVDMSYSASQQSLFSLLPKARTPWTEFVFSTGTQALAIALLAWVRLVYPTVISQPERTFRSIQLISTPVPVNHQPQPLPELPKPVVVAKADAPTTALRLPAPRPKAAEEAPPAPTVGIAPRKLDPLPMNAAPVIPKAPVRTNVFSTGSSATSTIARAPSQVQTGGFGDPNGIPAKAGQGKAVNIAALGSFDLPSGPGSGNGTGGSKGVAGVVASSGFGNGPATGNGRSRASNGTVQSSGFASADVPAAPTVRSHSAEATSRAVPAEILSKPTPVYTSEAKSLRIEGEVLLEVVLEASGGLKVMRVVRGLGHGLDDNAVKAAEQIRFKPAMRDGQPADSTVVLHIIFQLA
jgi:TonB family protein